MYIFKTQNFSSVGPPLSTCCSLCGKEILKKSGKEEKNYKCHKSTLKRRVYKGMAIDSSSNFLDRNRLY